LLASLASTADLVASLVFIALLSLPIYLILCLPGAGAYLLIRRLMRGQTRTQTVALSFAAAALLAPVVITGHSPLVLPLPFGVWLGAHMGQHHIATMATVSAGLTFAAAFSFLRVRQRRHAVVK